MKTMSAIHFKTSALETHPTGSTYICDPPPEDSDVDIVVLVEDLDKYIETAREIGFTSDTDYAGEYFISLRLRENNIIATQNKEFYDKFVFATKVAKKMNLLKKEDRITLFQAILYNKIEE